MWRCKTMTASTNRWFSQVIEDRGTRVTVQPAMGKIEHLARKLRVPSHPWDLHQTPFPPPACPAHNVNRSSAPTSYLSHVIPVDLLLALPFILRRLVTLRCVTPRGLTPRGVPPGNGATPGGSIARMGPCPSYTSRFLRRCIFVLGLGVAPLAPPVPFHGRLGGAPRTFGT